MRQKRSIVLIIHNVRSAHNVGSMFRTADGAGAQRVILTGYTPHPPKRGAAHLTQAEKAFRKTALGAEEYVPWEKRPSLAKVFAALKKEGFEIAALEQHEKSTEYREYAPKKSVALLVGNEVRGVDAKVLKRCDAIIEIPMRGKKHSLNVSVAAGIALYRISDTMGSGGKKRI